jgi:HK97 family phage prohead protease
MTIVYKTHTSDLRFSEDGFECLMSDETPDRYDDVIEARDENSWFLGNHDKNPIALFNHNADQPIGIWKNTRVEGRALRGRLVLAPEGTSPRIDEIRKLVGAGILRSVSVGFKPLESKPRPGAKSSGILYTKCELMECSLVSVPANPNALAVAKSMKISDRTMREVFRQQPTGDLTIAQRIRKARRAVRKARLLQEQAATPAQRKAMVRAIAHFEKQERELRAQVRNPKQTPEARALEVRAKAMALIAKIDARIARGEAASALGQQRQHEAETLAAFETHAQKHLDPPTPKYESNEPSWRGQKLPGLTWRGQKI